MYRRRLLEPHQRHCRQFKDADLDRITDPEVFQGIESTIYAASVAESEKGFVLPDILRERKERDETGRLVTTFYGLPSTWMATFKSPARLAKFTADRARA